MREFLHLNQYKLKRFFGVIALVFTIFASGIFLYTFIIDQVPEGNLIAVVFLFTCLIMPLILTQIAQTAFFRSMKKTFFC
jgi:4-amino-4-deoxy-L-arabinose transferase-like glycosyltransferase